ncbi:Glutamate receptor-like 52, partial [Homarus americanus]
MFQCAGNQEVGNLYRSRRNIKGKTISVVTIHRPPFVFLKTDSAGNIISQSGFAFEMLSQLQSKLGFKYKVALPYDGNWGTKLPNGTWNGMVGMVYRREADLGVAPFTITLERAQAIEFTFPFYVEPSSILTPVTRQTRKITAFLDPFHYKVWVVILITMVMLGPVMYLMARIQWLTFFYPHDNTHVATSPITLSGHYWILYASFVRQ